jgi:hypothetical protein
VITFINATPVLAEPAPKELALSVSAADSQLQWGVCPPFMPEGCELESATILSTTNMLETYPADTIAVLVTILSAIIPVIITLL